MHSRTKSFIIRAGINSRRKSARVDDLASRGVNWIHPGRNRLAVLECGEITGLCAGLISSRFRLAILPHVKPGRSLAIILRKRKTYDFPSLTILELLALIKLEFRACNANRLLRSGVNHRSRQSVESATHFFDHWYRSRSFCSTHLPLTLRELSSIFLRSIVGTPKDQPQSDL